jgi:hypothetical protein
MTDAQVWCTHPVMPGQSCSWCPPGTPGRDIGLSMQPLDMHDSSVDGVDLVGIARRHEVVRRMIRGANSPAGRALDQAALAAMLASAVLDSVRDVPVLLKYIDTLLEASLVLSSGKGDVQAAHRIVDAAVDAWFKRHHTPEGAVRTDGLDSSST